LALDSPPLPINRISSQPPSPGVQSARHIILQLPPGEAPGASNSYRMSFSFGPSILPIAWRPASILLVLFASPPFPTRPHQQPCAATLLESLHA
jgi:hypothetical protein